MFFTFSGIPNSIIKIIVCINSVLDASSRKWRGFLRSTPIRGIIMLSVKVAELDDGRRNLLNMVTRDCLTSFFLRTYPSEIRKKSH